MSMTWREAVSLALSETHEAYNTTGYDCPPPNPGPEEFVGTFRSFYDEIMLTHRISIYPVDPAGSHRMAESRAQTEYVEIYDDY
jgi:hypothetical protein